MYREEALPILCNTGFQARIPDLYQRNNCRGDGVILRQHPDAGTTAAFGTVVELVLCYDDGSNVPDWCLALCDEFPAAFRGEAWEREQRIGDDLVCLPDGPTP